MNAQTRGRIRASLDSWPFWVGIAYFGLAAVTVALWVNYTRVSTDQRHTAIVVAERGADIQAQYQVCLKSVPVIGKFDRFVHGVQTVNETLLRNSIASHTATPRGTALYRAQVRNIARLRGALRETSGLSIPIATKKECLRARNGRRAR